ncbi:MAG: NAD+ synthase [Anaerolineae bacterium]|nr:NAD+ synthase [Anaerolineae bacterium]
MDYEVLAESLVVWLREYARQAQATGFVVGLSGGIDSATSAALAVRAVGVENVLGVWLPCHSQPEDVAFARLAAESLGLEPLTVELSETYDTLLAALPPGHVLGAPAQDNDMARANLKPRLRMATLYYLAQARNALVLGTGNRAEMMVGYFTKYGDGGVDLEPLGELYKHEVRQLARVLDVPEPLITRPPTAGLWPGQTDEGELGITYDELDAILAALEAGRELQASPAAVARIRRMVAASAHKRAMPPAFPLERAGDCRGNPCGSP